MPVNLTDMQAYIDEMNAGSDGSWQVANADHFYECYGFTTRQELADMFTEECFHNVYKDKYGYRPRGYSIAEMERMLAKWAQEDSADADLVDEEL